MTWTVKFVTVLFRDNGTQDVLQLCIMRRLLTLQHTCPLLLILQGQCGASYAFSAVGALEGAWSLAHGKLTLLSEQNIIDCSGIHHMQTNSSVVLTFLVDISCTVPYGNYGCQGGNMYNAYQYVVANEGLDSQTTYSYKGRVNEEKVEQNSLVKTHTVKS